MPDFVFNFPMIPPENKEKALTPPKCSLNWSPKENKTWSLVSNPTSVLHFILTPCPLSLSEGCDSCDYPKQK